MSVIRLALITVAAGLLMAPGLGNVSVGDGSATVPIGSQPIGPREGGSCPTFSAAPSLHVGLRFESYANNDPISALEDQGSEGLDFSQGTGSMQPTALVPCESGKLSEQPCGEGDAGDIIASATRSGQSQPSLVCMLLMPSTTDMASGSFSHMSGGSAVTEHDIWTVNGNLVTRSGSQINAGLALTANNYHWICGHFDGASSQIWVDGASAATGSGGSDSWIGMTLFARYNGTQNNSSRIAEAVYFDTVTTASTMVADIGAVWDCVYGGGFPQALDAPPLNLVDLEIPRELKRYAQRLYKRGVPRAEMNTKLIARGLTRDEARQLTRSVHGRQSRDVDTLHTVKISFAAPIVQRDVQGALIAEALCNPIADQDGAVDQTYAACVTDETPYLHSERWCEVGQLIPVVAAARAWVTADEADDLEALRDGPRLRFRRNATDARHLNLVQTLATDGGFGTVERCSSEAPL